MESKRDIRIIVGTNLQLLRRKFHITQANLAEKLDVSVSHIANIERGECSASLTLIQKITELFGITPNELLLVNPELEENSSLSKNDKLREIISNNIETLCYKLYSDVSKLIEENSDENIYSIKHKSNQKKSSVADVKKDFEEK